MRITKMGRRGIGLGAIALGLAVLGGCNENMSQGGSGQASSPAAAAPAGTNITIDTFQFKPKSVTVPVGTTVVWTNTDPIRHTVTSGTADKPGGPLAGDLPEKGATYKYTFTTAGDYPYYCTVHTSMTGEVIVTP